MFRQPPKLQPLLTACEAKVLLEGRGLVEWLEAREASFTHQIRAIPVDCLAILPPNRVGERDLSQLVSTAISTSTDMSIKPNQEW